MSISIIIPAKNEALTIRQCLESIAKNFLELHNSVSAQAILVLNGCTDDTEQIATDCWKSFASHTGQLKIIHAGSGKANALNHGDAHATGKVRIYVDADITLESGLIPELWNLLNTEMARFASGTIKLVAGKHWPSAAYSRIWGSLPFVSRNVSGCGLHAVNDAGRKRWQSFPVIHSDDKFVRSHFSSEERLKANAGYTWPVPSRFHDLVKVRSRWCRGNSELEKQHPSLALNDESRRLSLAWILQATFSSPASLMCFIGIFVIAHIRAYFFSNSAIVEWERGRE